MKPNAVVRSLVDDMGKQLSNEFERLKSLYYNPNTKGMGYEKVLKDILDDYLGSIVTLDNRCFLIDHDLKLLNNLTPEKDEYDVVATFNNACPRIVLLRDPMKYVPLDAVAFLIEVKQTLTKTDLGEDLEKLECISSSDTSGRFGATFKGAFSVDYPIKILAYYEKSIKNDEFFKLLNEQLNNWDMIIIVKDDLLFVNPTLPWVQKRWEEPEIEKFHPHSLFWLILILSISFTMSPMTHTVTTFLNMWNSYYEKT